MAIHPDPKQLDETIFDNEPKKQANNYNRELYNSSTFRVVFQNNHFFLPQIHHLIKEKLVINLRPEYQRRLRWPSAKNSALIESLLLNIPIPPIYLYESDLARYEVMDGQQRLNAIFNYMENDFPLRNLSEMPFLNGMRFRDLPSEARRTLDRASVSAIVLLQETRSDAADPYKVRREVFERLNTGGEKLNPQEIRNSLYRGRFNDMIIRLSRHDLFCDIFRIPRYEIDITGEYANEAARSKISFYRTMGDCQTILRFFAFRERDLVSGSVRSILDKCMMRHKDLPEDVCLKFENDFILTMHHAFEIFGPQVFKFPGENRISVPVFDAIMVALYYNLDAAQLSSPQNLREHIIEKIRSKPELYKGKANTALSIKERIDRVEEAIREVRKR